MYMKPMDRFVLKALMWLVLITCASTLWGQENTPAPIAPFEITLTNGKAFKATHLKKGPVVLMYFSPDCGHCRELIRNLLKNYTLIRNKQVVLISFHPLKEVQKFDRFFGLSLYPNILIGTEGYSFRVQKYYGIHKFPFLALYNDKGTQLQTLAGERPFAEVAGALRKF